MEIILSPRQAHRCVVRDYGCLTLVSPMWRQRCVPELLRRVSGLVSQYVKGVSCSFERDLYA